MIQETLGRFFIDLTRPGCPCGCRYCYVPTRLEKLLSGQEIDSLADQVVNHSSFIPGPTGTLLTLGSHSDLFRTPALAEVLLQVLEKLAGSQNPIQIATKHPIPAEWAADLARLRSRERQIVVFVSCATLQWAKILEPGAAEPSKRFQSFLTLAEQGIPTCLYLKPVIPEVMAMEVEGFSQVINAFHPDAVCLGALYLNPEIRAKLGHLHLSFIQETGGLFHPLMDQQTGSIRPDKALMDDFHQRNPQTPLFLNSACVVAYLQQHWCPTRIWVRYPELCVRCQDCAAMADS